MEIYENLSLEDLPNEEWRDVVEYEGLYQVSNLGRVKSLERKGMRTERMLRQNPSQNGYLAVTLQKERKRKTFKTHKLVAMCFLPIEDGKNEINHIDEDKQNNKLDNLMRCDRSFNINYGSRSSVVSYKLRNRSDQSKVVLQLNNNGEVIKRFRSVAEASRFYNCFPSCIQRVCVGKNNEYKGMYFKYQ
jgi:hypothetical protein